jgi:L,D-transpeptidase ErfK/SrfK
VGNAVWRWLPLLVAATLIATGCAPALRIGSGPGESATYRVSGKATLLDVAQYYRLGYVEVIAANPGVDPWIPGRGTRVVLPTYHLPPRGDHDGIVVNLGDMRLYHFDNGKLMRSYAIGIGREGLSTPLGRTAVVRKQADPTWRPTARMRREKPELPAEVPPGPDNPMGRHALYLGITPYAIHGTNEPFGVGRRVSSGCIRLYADDIAYLFARVPIGTTVSVVDEPVKIAWVKNDLYVEVHPTTRQTAMLEAGRPTTPLATGSVLAAVREIAKERGLRVDWDLVEQVATDRRGLATRVTLRSGQETSD